jgi:hypothetical protein
LGAEADGESGEADEEDGGTEDGCEEGDGEACGGKEASATPWRAGCCSSVASAVLSSLNR